MINTTDYNRIMDDTALTQEEKVSKVQDLVAQHIKDETATTIGHDVNAPAVQERLVQALKEVFALRVNPPEPSVCTVTQDEHDPTLLHFCYEIQPGQFGRAVGFVPDKPEDRDFLTRYFHTHLEYPDVTSIMMEPGVYQEYVGTTFLSAWITRVNIISAFLITRYRPHAQNILNVQKFNAKLTGHCDLGRELDDDTLLLAVEKDRPGHYWFFWVDQDCSDSAVGRFITADPRADVVESFAAYAQECSLDLSAEYSGNTGLGDNVVRCPALELNVKQMYHWVTL
jgi:hypothetical protein